MKIVMFYHSLLSDWNHSSAHFLRGVVTELMARGHSVTVYEPLDNWSRQKLVEEFGITPIREFRQMYPHLDSVDYDPATLNLDRALDGAELVIVHEWTDPALVQRIGQHHTRHPHYTLLFHDTHHRSVTNPADMTRYDLIHYDGVLAAGEVIRQAYLQQGWAKQVWTWYEAADTRLFRPLPSTRKSGDLVWIGNWGDDEHIEELKEFLIQPVKQLRLKAAVYGVRYTHEAREALASAGIEYHGWLPNYRVPEVLAQYRLTLHIPRRTVAEALPGVPNIRIFEALACGVPLISAPWKDSERLFTPGQDYLISPDGADMRWTLRRLLDVRALGTALAEHAVQTIQARHTCAHRVDELMAIYDALAGNQPDSRIA